MSEAVPEAARPARTEPLGVAGYLRQVAAMLRPHWGSCLLVAVALLVEVAFFLAVPFGYRAIFDTAIPNQDVAFLLRVLAAIAAGFVLVALAELGMGYLTAALGARIMNELRLRMFRHLQRLSPGFYARTSAGDLMSRFSNDLHLIDRTVTSSLHQVLAVVIMGAASIALLFYLEWHLAVVALILLPVTAVGPKLFSQRATRAGYERKQHEAQLASVVQESVQAHKVVQAFGLQQTVLDRFRARLGDLYGSSVRAALFSACVGKISSLGVLLGILAVIGTGAWLTIAGLLTLGTLIAFMAMLMNLGDSATRATQLLPDLLLATASMQRVDELLAERPDVVDADEPVELPPFCREIRFDGVSFSYTGEQNSLEEVSFVIPAGQSVAFVGGSGSGKSTVLNLLTRFYDTSRGQIAIDGHAFRAISQASLRRQMSAVFQDTYLFDTTVRENIRQGRLDAGDDEVEAAAKLAEIHDFVLSLPRGYDTPVGEAGGRLSGGQRQRIALARALLRNPSILVLDEATSALDPATEAAINATLERLSRGRTIVAVTHRLSAVVNADRIFVLDRGRLVESGTHKELLNRKGAYYRIWQEFSLELTQSALVGDVHVEQAQGEVVAADVVGEAALAQRLQEVEAERRSQQQELERLRAINQRWAQLAGTDRLTGLPNKVAFVQALAPEALQQARRRGESVGFILLSGDNLGPINETYGRDAGDVVIRGLAGMLQSALKGEELLGHIDGTHFGVALWPADVEATRQRAQELRARVSEQAFDVGGAQVRITISVGVTAVDSAAVEDARAAAEQVLQSLNGALYAAKRAGGDRVETVTA